MANKEHLEILKKGVKSWNDWRLKNRHIMPDISGVDFRFPGLMIELSGANLCGANFKAAKMAKANLIEAQLLALLSVLL